MAKTFAKSPSFAGKIPLPEFNTIIAQHRNIQAGQQAAPVAGGVGGGAGRTAAQIGEKRMFGNEIRVWNGSQWLTP
jgi:hypothetical protein